MRNLKHIVAVASIVAAILIGPAIFRVSAQSTTSAMQELANTYTALNTFTAGVVANSVTGLTAAITPNAAGGTDVGSAAKPFANVYVGGAATNNIKITGTATGARTLTLPDASITASGAVYTDCGTSASCASPFSSPQPYVVTGCPSFSSSTTLGVTGLSFPNAVTSVQVTEQGATGVTFKVSSVSTSGFTITASGSNSDKICFTAVGY